MSSLSRELVFLILQFLDEEKFKETVHKLEQESGFFFNMKYFEDQVQNGAWDEVERYLSGFTKVDDNRYSMKIFFEIRKQKYLEALDKHDRAKAVEILVKDLKVFSSFNEDLYKEITQLLTLDNFRENEQLSKYVDTKSARHIMLMELKKLIEANPLFREKLSFPLLKASRLRTLINQSLNWQHQLCKNPRPNPDIKTLFVDHTCGPPNGARPPPPANGALVGSMPKAGVFPPLGGHGPYPAGAPPAPGAIAGWMGNPNAPNVAGTPAMGPASNAGVGSRPPKTPPTVEYQSADSEAPPMKKVRLNDEVGFSGQNVPHSIDDIPKTVARTIIQGSCVVTLEFHPLQQTVLLVGTNVGEIAIWEVATLEKLVSRSFKVWELPACSMQLQAALVKDPAVTTNRVVWSPDGALLGVAFSKHIVQIYQYYGIGELRQHLELDAHVGNVNDLAFAHPNKQLCIISCGDDKTIKVWEAATGRKLYTFEGHEAPVYSVCPHHKEAIQFIFSTAVDGKIKAWLYDGGGSKVDYDAPGNWCTTMTYSADGTRLFSCGSSKDGDSYLVEWNETEGAIKRTYLGFRKRIQCVAAFDTTRNCFLAVGDDFAIKFWDMDNVNMLTSVDAEGGLPACPRLRFNKEGSLLAVTTMDNGFKILANADGLRILRSLEGAGKVEPVKQAGPIVATSPIVGVDYRPIGGPIRVGEEPISKTWKMTEIMEPVHCRCIKLPDNLPASKVSRLIFTSRGGALLALASNAVHKLWKWPRNPLGRATTNVAPSLWQPPSGMLMTNDISGTNPEAAVACLALSKNDSYVVSASGGKVSLFNMTTFKVMTTFLPPPPAVTFLAFHPMDNNIIAIGLEDSTIQIYNVRVDEVNCRLKGHQKRITGLAFSTTQQLMVSCGADDQLALWATEGWQKLRSKPLQLPPARGATGSSDTKIQFHNDQTRLLVVHETVLAVYDTPKLERIRQWIPQEVFQSSISNGTYSCCGKSIYVAFVDGTIGVFEAEMLRPFSRIHPSAYLPQGVSGVYPLVVAAHPSEPTLIGVGLTDGGIRVLEPLEAEGKWGSVAPLEIASLNLGGVIPATAPAAVGPTEPVPVPTGAATTAAGGSSDQASR